MIDPSNNRRRLAMKIDLTTKLLVGALTLGVWALLLKPAVTPEPARAAEPSVAPTPALALGNDGIYVAVPTGQSGTVYRFKGTLAQPTLIGVYGK
jgi:hypothetical protein